MTHSATDKLKVPIVIPASEMIAITDTKRSRRRASKYRSPIRNS
jgi:hypothetical protein